MVQVAVVIPALNEAESLDWLLPQFPKSYRVVVVDNRSTDGTFDVATSRGASCIRCLDRGYGAAVQAGFAYLAKGRVPPDVVVVYDADGTSPLGEIKHMAQDVVGEGVDLVIGQRCFLASGAMPWHARMGNLLVTRLIWILTGYRYKDMGSLRALSWKGLVQMDLEDPTWGWNVEMQIKAACRGLKIKERDISYQRRRYGRSKISGSLLGSLRASSRMMYAIFFYRFSELGFWRAYPGKRRFLALF